MKYIVIHTSGVSGKHKFTTIHKNHIKVGYDGVAYHYGIEDSGCIVHGRPLFWEGAHARGHNKDSIGICVLGNMTCNEDQRAALLVLVEGLKLKYPEAKVVGHSDLDPVKKPNCPGFDINWLKVL